MKTNLTVRLSALAGLISIAGSAFADEGTYTATFGGLTGLYTGNGGLLTSNVSFVDCTYKLEYLHSTSGSLLTYYAPSNIWPTSLKISFNSSNWQNYRYSGVNFAVQVCNYIVTKPPTGTVSISRVDEFWGPNAAILWWNNGFQSVTTYSTVNPRQFNLSEFDVDPTDLTGKTAVKRWHASSSPPYPYPWQDQPDTTVINQSNWQGFIGVVHAYAKLNQNICGISHQQGGAIQSYPISPDLLASAKKAPEPNSLAARAFSL